MALRLLEPTSYKDAPFQYTSATASGVKFEMEMGSMGSIAKAWEAFKIDDAVLELFRKLIKPESSTFR